MLPLHYCGRAIGRGRVRYSAIVRFLVMSIGGEGVGDACVVGFNQVVVYGIVEALREPWSAGQGGMYVGANGRTGPVSTERDLLDHVPA